MTHCYHSCAMSLRKVVIKEPLSFLPTWAVSPVIRTLSRLLLRRRDGQWAATVQGFFPGSPRFTLRARGHPPHKESLGRTSFGSHAKAISMPEKERVLWEHPRKCRDFVIFAEWLTHWNAKEQDGIFAGKEKTKSLGLLRHDLIFQHLKNRQSVLEISPAEWGIEAKTPKRVCAFSVTSYWYSFPSSIFSTTFLTGGDLWTHLSCSCWCRGLSSRPVYQTPYWSLGYCDPGLWVPSSSSKLRSAFLHPTNLKRLPSMHSPLRHS